MAWKTKEQIAEAKKIVVVKDDFKTFKDKVELWFRQNNAMGDDVKLQEAVKFVDEYFETFIFPVLDEIKKIDNCKPLYVIATNSAFNLLVRLLGRGGSTDDLSTKLRDILFNAYSPLINLVDIPSLEKSLKLFLEHVLYDNMLIENYSKNFLEVFTEVFVDGHKI